MTLRAKKCKNCGKDFLIPGGGNWKYCEACRDYAGLKWNKAVEDIPAEMILQEYKPNPKQLNFMYTSIKYLGQNKSRKEIAEEIEVPLNTIYWWFCVPEHENFRKWYFAMMRKRLEETTIEVLDALILNATGQATKTIIVDGEVKLVRIDRADQNKAAELILKAQGLISNKTEVKAEINQIVNIPRIEDIQSKAIIVDYEITEEQEE
jgi:hypothetical protein